MWVDEARRQLSDHVPAYMWECEEEDSWPELQAEVHGTLYDGSDVLWRVDDSHISLEIDSLQLKCAHEGDYAVCAAALIEAMYAFNTKHNKLASIRSANRRVSGNRKPYPSMGNHAVHPGHDAIDCEERITVNAHPMGTSHNGYACGATGGHCLPGTDKCPLTLGGKNVS